MSTAITTELVELGRFFAITSRRLERGDIAPEMFSGAIDAAWHRLIENGQVDAFALERTGRTFGHSPVKGEGFISWVTAYEEAYGPLPEIWFTDVTGTVNAEALAAYRDTGKVWGEWDCSPAPGDGDGAQEKVTA